MKKDELINEALRLPTNAISYYVTQQLALLFPDKVCIEIDDTDFQVGEYSKQGLCTVTPLAGQLNEIITHYQRADYNADVRKYVDGYLWEDPYNAFYEITWQGSTLTLLTLHWTTSAMYYVRYWLLADTEQQARQFIQQVCSSSADVRDEILIFDHGCWSKDARLFQDIKNADFDNLILPDAFKEEILLDLQHFFSTHAVYQRYNVPWKRGILFIGTPGNGKTHTLKALINLLKRPCIYVKSFDEDSVSVVFARARNLAPCLLVFEDLDSLLDDENRAFFLNELDGFAANEGIVILATTNHPERLDAAILDRPSRFDRKYHFHLPDQEMRARYIAFWNASFHDDLRVSEQCIQVLTETTRDFSFAYLKELMLSSIVKRMSLPETEIEQVLLDQVVLLREQMTTSQSL